ncbi:MAG: hypothetical protein JWR50_3120 [Mucilaginibacter sp.]|nr:hypothetical protein [Mucilaginibacter sp.]
MKKIALSIIALAIALPSIAQWLPNGATSGTISYSGGNVGIGLTNPGSALEVLGSVAARNSTTTTTNGISINAGNTNTPGSANVNRIRIGGNDTYSGYFTIQGPGNADYLTIYNNYVGIGTTMPGSYLDVSAPSASQGIRSINLGVLGGFSGGGVLAVTPNVPTATAQRLGTMAMGATFDTANPSSYRYTGSVNAYAAEPWSTTANGTYLTFNTTGLGTTSYSEKMRIDASGNIGIGTTTPSQRLDVYQNEVSQTDVLYPIVIDRNWNGNGGVSTPRSTGLLFKDINSIEAGVQAVRENSFSNFKSGMAFLVNTASSSSMVPTTSLTEVMRINSSGNLGIGTTAPDAKLAVNGTIHTQEVKVDMNGWNDAVFDKTYPLLTLSSVKTFIDQNHHLPEMPSEAEVIKNGVNLGEMVKLQTKKIEELTLYLIDKDTKLQSQQKQIENQNKQIANQQTKSNQQDARIDALEKALSKLTASK